MTYIHKSLLQSHEAEVYIPVLHMPNRIRLLYGRDKNMVVQAGGYENRLGGDLAEQCGQRFTGERLYFPASDGLTELCQFQQYVLMQVC